MNTGWIRYWICDRSGIGHSKWKYIYEPSGFDSENEAEQYIIEKFESWAKFAESYSFHVELNTSPPVTEYEHSKSEFNKSIFDKVQSIFSKWDLHKINVDEYFLFQMQSSLTEAMMCGIVMGGNDKDIYNLACELQKKIT